jgi:alpha-glucosidase
LPDLRKDYLELTGRPPVPPKKMFRLWVSEYGYDNWRELDSKLKSLRANNFPLDGFVLDLQWFGGVTGSSDNSRMGAVDWDLQNFPDPAGKLAALNQQGVGIMTIEEPYISRGLPEYEKLAGQGFLARTCSAATCPPVYLTSNPWWGQGSLLDWTNPAAGAFWHDWKREAMIAAGVIGHWTDLGEPEMYDPSAWYYGIQGDYAPLTRHADVHNLYNLLWSQSVYDGYVRNGHTQRPFIMSRSGAPGSQRYGAAMWSGDIGSNMASLAGQFSVQRHMALSGMDYFGSDIGGFHRGALDGDLDALYTQWFAYGSLFDVPVRAHTENLCNCKETAPDRIGDEPSNLANIRLRYTLSPYLYSLSHMAYLTGEPVFPPLVYAFQQDERARGLFSEKLIGPNLLVSAVADYQARQQSVYLPAGVWYDYYTNQRYESTGTDFGPFELYPNGAGGTGGALRLPLFARAGAIIPQMYVDEQTMNIMGLRKDGSTRDELIARVYAGEEASQFTLYEDDGVSTAYQSGELRSTLITQQGQGAGSTGGGGQVTIAAAQGSYTGAPEQRNNVVEWVSADADQISSVTLNGAALPKAASLAEWQQADRGWFVEDGMVRVKTGVLAVGVEKVVEIDPFP